MRYLFVVQRYGEEIIGGAESLARQVAERLAASGDQVTVFTTTAVSYRTWKPELTSGVSFLNGVSVHRFDVLYQRHRILFGVVNRLFSRFLAFIGKSQFFPKGTQKLIGPLEQLWFRLQGPYCPALLEALKEEAPMADTLFFITYLYWPTVYGFSHFAEKSVLIPTAHWEPPFSFPCVLKLLATAKIQIVNSQEEEDLLREHLKFLPSKPKFFFAGAGLDEHLFHRSTEKKPQEGLPSSYLLFLGRISRGKGVQDLCSLFLKSINSLPQNMLSPVLVLAGAVEADCEVPQHPSIRVLGQVSEDQKWTLLLHARGLVNPSPKESLSLVVLEALVSGRPVLVNGASPVLKKFESQVATVLSYEDQASFRLGLMRLLDPSDTVNAPENREYARQWVREYTSWDRVLGVYRHTSRLIPELSRDLVAEA